MSVARKKPRDRRSPSSLAKLAQCQGASRAHLPQQWKRGVQDARRGGGTPSWSPFLHVSPPKKSGRPAEWRTRSPATADFHGAFFFRGRVRRVPLFPVNTAEISGSGVKGKKEETRGQRADFPWKWKAFATPFTDTLASPVALLSYFRFFRDTFSLASILPALISDEEISISIYLCISRIFTARKDAKD